MIPVHAMALVSHLRGRFGFAGHFTQSPRLGDVMGQRFLAIDSLVQLQREERGGSVVMVRGGDNDDVELFADLIEHPTVIREHLDLVGIAVVIFQVVLYFIMLVFIRIHYGHDVVLSLRDDQFQVAHSAVPAADMHAIELIAGPGCPENVRSNQGDGRKGTRGQRGPFEKGTTSEGRVHK